MALEDLGIVGTLPSGGPAQTFEASDLVAFALGAVLTALRARFRSGVAHELGAPDPDAPETFDPGMEGKRRLTGGTGRGTVSGASPGAKVASRSLDRFTVELRVDLTPIQGEGEVNVSWGVPEHSNNFLAGVVGGRGKIQALRNNNCL